MIPANTLNRTHPFFRFALVGAINTIAGLFIMLMLLNAVGFSYWLSTFIGNAVGAAISYFLNRAFTFKSKVRFSKGVPRFLVVILCCYFLSYWLSARIVEFGLGTILPKEWTDEAAVLLGGLFYTISNYIGQKKFVFREIK
ncbi:GtrA-like protein [Bacillus sp. B-jedd]|nr:GtrA-like protein [Bacillus sp. B-jedd]